MSGGPRLSRRWRRHSANSSLRRRWKGRGRWAVHWNHVCCARRDVDGGAVYSCRRGAISDFLLKIADHNIQRAAGQKIGRGIVIARLAHLPVGGGAGEISQRHPCHKHYERENDNKGSGLGCRVTRAEKLLHRGVVPTGSVGLRCGRQRCGYSKAERIFHGGSKG